MDANLSRKQTIKVFVMLRNCEAHLAGTCRCPTYWRALREWLRKTLTEQNMPMVHWLFSQARGRDVGGDDLFSDGQFALVKAIDGFDPRKGYAFSTYLYLAITRAFWQNGLVFERVHGTNLDESRMSARRWRAERVQGRHEQEDKTAELTRLREILASDDCPLNENEMGVIGGRFIAKRQTLEQLSTAMGVTKERVRQIQNTAIRKLRVALGADGEQ